MGLHGIPPGLSAIPAVSAVTGLSAEILWPSQWSKLTVVANPVVDKNRIKIILANGQWVWRTYSPSANHCTWVRIRNNQLPEDKIGWTTGYIAVPQNNEPHPSCDCVVS